MRMRANWVVAGLVVSGLAGAASWAGLPRSEADFFYVGDDDEAAGKVLGRSLSQIHGFQGIEVLGNGVVKIDYDDEPWLISLTTYNDEFDRINVVSIYNGKAGNNRNPAALQWANEMNSKYSAVKFQFDDDGDLVLDTWFTFHNHLPEAELTAEIEASAKRIHFVLAANKDEARSFVQ